MWELGFTGTKMDQRQNRTEEKARQGKELKKIKKFRVTVM
jgi:hypothetical protein